MIFEGLTHRVGVLSFVLYFYESGGVAGDGEVEVGEGECEVVGVCVSE